MHHKYPNFGMTFSYARTQKPAARTPLLALALGLLAAASFFVVAPAPAQAKYTTFVLASPSNNKTVKNKVVFSALLEKDLQRRAWGIEFWIDSERVAIDRKPPYSRNIDTRKLTNGQHVFRISLLVKSKNGKGPDVHVCEFLRAVYVNVKNKHGKASDVSASAAKKLPLPGPIANSANRRKKWSLKFRDEFSGTMLNAGKWTSQREDWISGGNPYNNREGAWYKPENSTVAGGSLVQTIRQELSGDARYTDKAYQYSTGMVNTHKRFSFQYGYIEARVKVPSCRGCWPVFWSLPESDTWPPEVDFFEYIDTAAAERRPFVASHWQGAGGLQTELYYYTTPCGTATDYTDSWHTYGFLWTPGKIQPYLDGVPGPIMTGPSVPHVPMYLIMALSTVDSLAPADGSKMLTDYVRVWQPAPR
jgi:beta-glucanase (GH16 family)